MPHLTLHFWLTLLVLMPNGFLMGEETPNPGPVLLTAGNVSAFLRDDGTFTLRNLPSFSAWGRLPENGLTPGPLVPYRVRARTNLGEFAATEIFNVPLNFGGPRMRVVPPILQSELANAPEIKSIRVELSSATILVGTSTQIRIFVSPKLGPEMEVPLTQTTPIWVSPNIMSIDSQRFASPSLLLKKGLSKCWVCTTFFGHTAQTRCTIVTPQSDLDTDGDGLFNDWERLYGFNATDPTDGLTDPDGDSLSNLEEFIKGTNPLNPDTDADGISDNLDPEPLTPERVPPMVTLISPTDNQVIDPRDDQFIYAGTVSDNASVRSSTLTIDKRSIPLLVGDSFSLTQRIADLPEPIPAGAVTIALSAVDRAGNQTTVSRSILVQPIPPQVAIGVPASGTTVSRGSTIPVQIIATDDRRVAAVDLLINGVLVSHLTTEPFTARVTVPNDATDFTVVVRAIDDFGNSTEATRTLSVTKGDERGPELDVTPGEGFVAVAGSTVDLTVLATDVSGVANIAIRVDTGIISRPNPSIAHWIWNVPSSSGPLSAEIIARDTFGNETVRVLHWTVASESQAVSVIYPATDTTWVAGCHEALRVAVPLSWLPGLQSRLFINGVVVQDSTSSNLTDGRTVLTYGFQVPRSTTSADLTLELQSVTGGFRRLHRTVPVQPWPGVLLSGQLRVPELLVPGAAGAVWVESLPPVLVDAEGRFELMLIQPPANTTLIELCGVWFNVAAPSAGCLRFPIDSRTARSGRAVAPHLIESIERPGARLSDGTAAPMEGRSIAFDPSARSAVDRPTKVRLDGRGGLVYGDTVPLTLPINATSLTSLSESLDRLPSSIAVIFPSFSNAPTSARVLWYADDNQAVATWITTNGYGDSNREERAMQVWLRRFHEPHVAFRTNRAPSDFSAFPVAKVSHDRFTSGWRGLLFDYTRDLAIPRSTVTFPYDYEGTAPPLDFEQWWNWSVAFTQAVTPESGYDGNTPVPFQDWFYDAHHIAPAFSASGVAYEVLPHSYLISRVVSNEEVRPDVVIHYAGHDVRTDRNGIAIVRIRDSLAPRAYRIYVTSDATGAGDGSSWVNACTSIEAAHAAAELLDRSDIDRSAEIWVAQGVYRPTVDPGLTDPRLATFNLSSNKGIEWLGGFNGNETSRDQADPARHPTILSGDIGTLGDTMDNVNTVVTAHGAASLRMDGFTIADGNGGNGAGLQVSQAALRRCLIRDNHADTADGGGIGSTATSPYLRLEQCILIGNSARRGGAVAMSNAYITMTNCLLAANTATTAGHAVWTASLLSGDSSQLILAACTVADAPVSDPAIGMFVKQGLTSPASTTVRRTVFRSTVATSFSQLVPGDAECELCLAPIALPGTGNLVGQPMFQHESLPTGDDGWWGTADDGYILASGSPGVDGVVTMEADVLVDLAGSSRSAGEAIDIGAYEHGGLPVISLGEVIPLSGEEGSFETGPMTITDPDDPTNSLTLPAVGLFQSHINIIPKIEMPVPAGLGNRQHGRPKLSKNTGKHR